MSDPREHVPTSGDFTLIREITPGHTGCEVLHVEVRGVEKVFKQSILPEGVAEIRANSVGYGMIEEAGAGLLVPQPNVLFIEDDTLFRLEIPYLGHTITHELGNNEALNWDRFWLDVQGGATEGGSSQPGSQAQGLAEYTAQTAHWLDKVAPYFPDLPSVSQLLTNVPLESLTGNGPSTLMLLDFTPDNTFMTPAGVKFIDPWTQATYQGSFLPSVGQFDTLLRRVYGFEPNADYDTKRNEAANALAQHMGLTSEQGAAHLRLGAALQYTLSAFVRLESNEPLARQYYEQALREVSRIVS